MCVVSSQPLPTEAKLIVFIKQSRITNLWTSNLLYDVGFEIESFFCIVYPRWEPTKGQYIVGVNHIKFKRDNYGIILKSICTVESSIYKIFLVNLRPKINMKPKNKVYKVLDCIMFPANLCKATYATFNTYGNKTSNMKIFCIYKIKHYW